jgi:protein-disulfide isomerase
MTYTEAILRLGLALSVGPAANLAAADERPQKGEVTSCSIAGSEGAPLTIEEYADFECPHCVRGSHTMKEVLKNYPGKVKLVFRNRPLPFHENALVAAKAFSAVCMQSPSLAFSFQKEIFDNQNELVAKGESFLYDTAEKLGVNVSRMKFDMSGDVVAASLAEDQRLAELHKFNGTPSFMIGTEPIVGAQSYEEIKKIVDKQLGI